MSILSSRHLLAATLVGAAIAYSPSALAGSTTSILNVSATIQASCTSISSYGFPLDNINQTQDYQTYTTINVTCTGGSPHLITLDAGLNGSGTGSGITRNMKNANNDLLPYNLYIGYPWESTTVWGNDAASGVSGSSSNNYPVSINVPAKPDAPNGNYTDAVVMTLTY